MGRRLSRTVAGTTTKYLYDGATVVQEQDSANSATANLLTGLGIDQALSRTDSAGERSFLTDALGSVLAPTDTWNRVSWCLVRAFPTRCLALVLRGEHE